MISESTLLLMVTKVNIIFVFTKYFFYFLLFLLKTLAPPFGSATDLKGSDPKRIIAATWLVSIVDARASCLKGG